jgi:3'(2'), 5'-bisphosphate nucleotidase
MLALEETAATKASRRTRRGRELNDACLSYEDIASVCVLARQAGELALSMRSHLKVTEKAPGDIVTDADRALSELIVSELSLSMPNDLIVSEEGDRQQAASTRTWLIDPIDGTDYYVKNSRQFSVMIGLVVNGAPAYGWVYQPTEELLYWGGPGQGAFRQQGTGASEVVSIEKHLSSCAEKRIIIGRRDARNHPWLEGMPDVVLKQVGSIGVKVIWVLEDRADIVAQLHGLMSVWDTAAPAAIALGAGCEVGTGDNLAARVPFPDIYEPATFKHAFPIVIGRPGTLDWCRKCLMTEPGK